jgi:hypothetical protein
VTAEALAWWAEKTTFSPAVSIAFAKRPDALAIAGKLRHLAGAPPQERRLSSSA